MSDRAWPTRRSRLVGAVAAWTGALDGGEAEDRSARDVGESSEDGSEGSAQ